MRTPAGTVAATRERWERSFEDQIAGGAYNRAPVEALVRTVDHHLRERFAPEALRGLHFLELGCGAGPNLRWLAEKGIRVSGIDISPTAVALARKSLEEAGAADRIERLLEASVTDVPFGAGAVDGVVEACVFQHLSRADRQRAFAEVRRVLKPGGLFVGYMLGVGHTVFRARRDEQLADDPGSLLLASGGSAVALENLGLSHFFDRGEIRSLLRGFSLVDPCLTVYDLPRVEARRRGYVRYRQSMWTVYAVK